MAVGNSQVAVRHEHRMMVAKVWHRVSIVKCDWGSRLGFPLINADHIANMAGVCAHQIGTAGLTVSDYRSVANGICSLYDYCNIHLCVKIRLNLVFTFIIIALFNIFAFQMYRNILSVPVLVL